jgi:hypothetical protein
MKTKHLILSFLAFLICFSNLQAITLDEILDRHGETLGGIEAIQNIRTIHQQIEVRMGGITGQAEMYFKKPDKIRLMVELSIMSMEQGLYNDRYWIKDQTGTLRDMAGVELQQFKTEMYISAYDYLSEKELRQYIEYQGEVEFEGQNTYKLEFAPPEGSRVQMFFDPDDFLPIGSFLTIQGIRIKVLYSDWRVVEGVKMPFEIVQDLGNPMLLTTMTVTGIDVNSDIPEAIFHPPTSAENPHAFAEGRDFTTLPFTLNFNHIHISVMINGVGPFMFLLDSGAGMSVIGKHVADSLGLEDAGNMPAVGIGGIEVGQFGRVDSLRLGELTLYDLTSGVLDLGFFNEVATAPLDGILGYDLFSRLIVDVDYEKQILSVFESGFVDYPGGADTILCEIESNHPVIYATVNDSIRGRFRFDTGSQSYLDLNTPLVKKYNLLETAKKQLGSFPMIGVGGASESNLAILSSFAIGKSRIENVLTGFFQADSGIFAAENIDGNIGGGIMSMFRIGFDYPNYRIYLTKFTDADTDQGFITSGIYLQKNGEDFVIYRVLPSSTAEEEGLEKGDIIIEINKTKVQGMTLREVYDLLGGEEGDKIRLKIMRDDKTRKYKLKLKNIL